VIWQRHIEGSRDENLEIQNPKIKFKPRTSNPRTPKLSISKLGNSKSGNSKPKNPWRFLCEFNCPENN
jgi:hypothetical protein